jgi:outer membrane lipoprotein SlyB
MMVQKGRRVSWVVHILIVAFLVSGCASQYGQQITTVKYCPECYQPIQDLRNAEKQFNTTVAGSIVAGALLGAVVGGIATGKPQGALAGAAAGALVGGVAGYALAKQQKITDDNQRLASYLQDLDGDISGVDRVAAAAQQARKCYDRAFQEAVDAYKAGRMSRAELDDRYTEIKSGTAEANQILGTLLAGAGNKETQYQEALKSEAEKAKRPVPEPAVVVQAPEPAPVKAKPVKPPKKPIKRHKTEETPAPEAKPDVAKAAPKAPMIETGDKLADISTKKARLSESIKGVKEEKDQLEKAQAERQKALDQLTG